MSFHTLPAMRQVELLEMAEQLYDQLNHAPVERARGKVFVSQGDRGVSRASFSNALSFLKRGTDRAQLNDFVSHMDPFDRMTAQNRKNPKAEHRALRSVLTQWLRLHAELNLQEIHFVWAWTDRMFAYKAGSR